mmetsp:Transcript_37541/g.149701  ORF Transcript_37541/g.149701 Transcript_37541/m.149701 type:complete len:173 (+) Transcript_37541:2004-2522(+)
MDSRVVVETTSSRTFTDFEYSAVFVPRTMLRELRHVFAGVDLRDGQTIAVLTCQKASVPLTNWGDEEAAEKDRLLERFLVWAKGLRSKLEEKGFWSDFTDPCTGLPYNGDSSGSIYPDVDGFERLLRYSVDGSMGCRIMSHPKWRFSSYPATFFTAAPPEELAASLALINGL